MWTPEDDNEKNLAKSPIPQNLLEEILSFSRHTNWEEPLKEIPDNIINSTFLIGCDPSQWFDAVESWDNASIILLMRFFTVIENQFPDQWHAEEKSPVIFLGKALKKRKAFPGKEFVSWIKNHSSNRFLPHGPL